MGEGATEGPAWRACLHREGLPLRSWQVLRRPLAKMPPVLKRAKLREMRRLQQDVLGTGRALGVAPDYSPLTGTDAPQAPASPSPESQAEAVAEAKAKAKEAAAKAASVKEEMIDDFMISSPALIAKRLQRQLAEPCRPGVRPRALLRLRAARTKRSRGPSLLKAWAATAGRWLQARAHGRARPAGSFLSRGRSGG